MRIDVKLSQRSDILASAGSRLPLVNRVLDTVVRRALREYQARRRVADHNQLRDLAVGIGVSQITGKNRRLSEVADGG